jgi:hypothetical protein
LFSLRISSLRDPRPGLPNNASPPKAARTGGEHKTLLVKLFLHPKARAVLPILKLHLLAGW